MKSKNSINYIVNNLIFIASPTIFNKYYSKISKNAEFNRQKPKRYNTKLNRQWGQYQTYRYIVQSANQRNRTQIFSKFSNLGD